MTSAEYASDRAVGRIVASVIGLFLLSSAPACSQAHRVVVQGVQNGRSLPVPASGIARLEQLSLALLESTSYENDSSIANSETWNRYSDGDHLYFQFPSPSQILIMGKNVAFSEMMIPISANHAPPYIFVRNDGQIRAFCKYNCAGLTLLENELSAWRR